MIKTKPSSSKKKIRIVTPGSIVLNIFVVLVFLSHSCATIVGLISHANLTKKSVQAFDIDSQLRGIKRRICSGEDALQSVFLPEGSFLSNVFYGYSLINLSLSRPSDTSFRRETMQELELILSKIEQYQHRVPFRYSDKQLPGGVIFQGNMNRLRAGYILLGGNNSKIIDEFHFGSKLLYDAFSKANPPFPESFNGMTWPVDSICALDSLRLHDDLFQTDYSSARVKWLSWLKLHLDPNSGLMIAQAGKEHDSIVDGTRGCAMSWTLALLPSIDGEFAQQQYNVFREQWYQPFGCGLLGINEWYQGKERPTDFHAGPVIAGLGAAATGLGIAAAQANSDWESSHKILRSLELFGAPLYNIQGEKNYFFGLSLLCDTIALWGKTIVSWQIKMSPAGHSPPDSYSHSTADCFPLLILVCALVSIIITALLIRRLFFLWTSEEFTRPKRSWLITGIAVFQSLLILLWLLCPFVSWIQILICMTVANLMEELIIRPKIVAQLFK